MYIELIGRFQLRLAERCLTLPGQRLQSLLAYVVLNAGQALSRQHIAFQFWPDASEEHAYASLRKHIHDLKQRIPEVTRYLTTDRHSLLWAHSPGWTCDVYEFEGLYRADIAGADDLRRAMSLYQGELLPGCYDDWIVQRRETLQRQFRDLLMRGIQVLETQRCYSAAISVASRLLELDRLNEEAYCTLMRLYSLYGDRAAALRLYHDCAKMLRRELAISPSSETRTIYQDLLKAEKTAAQPHPGHKLPMVGRAPEWATLLQMLDTAQRGTVTCVTLQGAVGVGKSRLARELIEHASRLGWQQASARCHNLENALPFSALTDLLRQLSLEELEPAQKRELALLLPEMEARPRDALQSGLEPTLRRAQIFEAARRVLERVQPCVLLISNLQWCDTESLDWLNYLVCSQVKLRLLVLFTLRTEDLSRTSGAARALARLKCTTSLVEISIAPLDSQETRTLVSQLMDGPICDDVLELIHRESQGNPLYLVELWRSGYFQRMSEAHLPIPPTFHKVWSARLSLLEQPILRMAALVAVLRRPYKIDVLGQAAGLPQTIVLLHLSELVERGMLVERPDGTFEFTHPKLADCTRASLSVPLLRMHHLQAAQVLEHQIVQSGHLELHGEIAYHLECALDLTSAARHSFKAARAFYQVQAYQETLYHLQQVVRQAGRRDDTLQLRFDALILQEKIHDILGQRTLQQGCLDDLEALMRARSVPAHWSVQLGLLKARRWMRLGRQDMARPLLQAAASQARTCAPPSLQAEILLYLGQELYQRAPRDLDVHSILQEALVLAEQAGPAALRQEIYSMLTYVQLTTSRTRLPLPEASRALETPETSIRVPTHLDGIEKRELDTLIRGFRDQARFALSVGEPLLASEKALCAMKLAQRLNDPFQIAQHAAWIGFCHYLQRTFSDARRFLENALTETHRAGNVRREYSCLLWLAELELELGRHVQGRERLEEAIRFGKTHSDEVMESYLYASRARLALEGGDPLEAEQLAQKGIAQARSVAGGAAASEGVLCRWLGQALLEQGRLPEAERYLHSSIELCVGIDQFFHAQDARVVLASGHLRQGKPTCAVDELSTLVDELKQAPSRFVQPQHLLYVYARGLEETGHQKDAVIACNLAKTLIQETLQGLDPEDQASYSTLPVHHMIELWLNAHT